MKKLLLVLCLFLLQTSAWAASVTAVKNQKVLIDLSGASTSPGDEYFLVNPSGKKVAVIRIKQVKNNKALADILKGHADLGYTLQARAGESTPTPDRSSEKEQPEEKSARTNTDKKHSNEEESAARDTTYLRTLKNSYGLVGKLLMNSMTVDITDSLGGKGTASMSGSSFGVGGFMDFIATPDIAVDVEGALEQYNVTGTTRLSSNGTPYANSTDYSTKITYLSAYGLGKYYFTKSKYRVWAGIGGGFLIAMSKSSNALNENNIATNQVANAAVGVDIQWNRKTYIPVTLEYTYFPPTSTVKATSIVLKAGWAWNER